MPLLFGHFNSNSLLNSDKYGASLSTVFIF
jgi:hypothetical protein